jgi:hypothetical protein
MPVMAPAKHIRVVAEHNGETPNNAKFNTTIKLMDGGEAIVSAYLPRETFEAWGSPESLIVSLRPGDADDLDSNDGSDEPDED